MWEILTHLYVCYTEAYLFIINGVVAIFTCFLITSHIAYMLLCLIIIMICVQLSSIQQIMISQLSDGMMHPVNKFLQADVDGL